MGSVRGEDLSELIEFWLRAYYYPIIPALGAGAYTGVQATGGGGNRGKRKNCRSNFSKVHTFF